jgi:hypothetical protein
LIPIDNIRPGGDGDADKHIDKHVDSDYSDNEDGDEYECEDNNGDVSQNPF